MSRMKMHGGEKDSFYFRVQDPYREGGALFAVNVVYTCLLRQHRAFCIGILGKPVVSEYSKGLRCPAARLQLSEPLMVTIGGHPFGILWSIIGAALFVAIIHLVSRR